MANVQFIQRHAHLAGAVRIEFVNGRDGQIAKGVVTAISNSRRGSGDDRQEESTAIQWTLWGKQAEYAAGYLGRGSHVNLVGRLRSNNYQDASGADVYGWSFTVEEIDYLDTRAEGEARREREEQDTQEQGGEARANRVPAQAARARKPRTSRASSPSASAS
jgi:single stranded DNA-binding protein